jgi:hypothetical protein
MSTGVKDMKLDSWLMPMLPRPLTAKALIRNTGSADKNSNLAIHPGSIHTSAWPHPLSSFEKSHFEPRLFVGSVSKRNDAHQKYLLESM